MPHESSGKTSYRNCNHVSIAFVEVFANKVHILKRFGVAGALHKYAASGKLAAPSVGTLKDRFKIA
jgi:hypothetical protein